MDSLWQDIEESMMMSMMSKVITFLLGVTSIVVAYLSSTDLTSKPVEVCTRQADGTYECLQK